MQSKTPSLEKKNIVYAQSSNSVECISGQSKAVKSIFSKEKELDLSISKEIKQPIPVKFLFIFFADSNWSEIILIVSSLLLIVSSPLNIHTKYEISSFSNFVKLLFCI